MAIFGGNFLNFFNLIIILTVLLLLSLNKASWAAFNVHDCPTTQIPEVKKETTITAEDRSAIRVVIESQVAALRSRDFASALSFCNPALQHKFVSLENYIEIVKVSYLPIISPRSMVFEDLKEVMGIITQPVLFFAQDGDLIIASYTLEKQGNGEWKISDCYLAAVK